MSPLYLYAVLAGAPAGPLGAGMLDEPLRLIDCDGVFAAAGELSSAPPLGPETLRGHDAVVRRLAAASEALLPARFGTITPDEAQLRDQLARGVEGLREALGRVAGREQMILRIFSTTSRGPGSELAPPQAAAPADAGGPGTRYLVERARTQQAAADLHELTPLRPVLDRFVVAERIERHERRPLIASVYHLVARGTGGSYRAAVDDAARTLSGIRVTVSGPWAAYAFAPEALG